MLLLPCCTHCPAGVADYLAWQCLLGSACSWQLCLISLPLVLSLLVTSLASCRPGVLAKSYSC